MSLAVTALTCVSAIGDGLKETAHALRNDQGGLAPCSFGHIPLNTSVGEVPGLDEKPLDFRFAPFDCRNNRLAERALICDDFATRVADARSRYGAGRIAVIMGTSTSGILETETAYRNRDPITGALPASFRYRQTHNTFSIAEYTRARLGLTGVAISLSTACSSSAKAFASAARMISAGLADSAVVGGVDSLCMTTLCGFSSLDLVSAEPCRPCDKDRNGISIGEAAAYALLERSSAVAERFGILSGYGESSDGYHISSPHPEGLGAELAMRQALSRAGRKPDEITYINMHGTASEMNDRVEDQAIFRVFGDGVWCNSTKGWTGHTLGAAGALEAAISLLLIRESFIPGSLNTKTVDPSFRSRIKLHTGEAQVTAVLSNSFGFGGSNASLVFEA
ncbi:MAG: beta-ketoacyl-ACP synthase [Nitrospinae bacterium]|nr:beta-ketoacyl-ACP synthase [Nitrospinota bacterium]